MVRLKRGGSEPVAGPTTALEALNAAAGTDFVATPGVDDPNYPEFAGIQVLERSIAENYSQMHLPHLSAQADGIYRTYAPRDELTAAIAISAGRYDADRASVRELGLSLNGSKLEALHEAALKNFTEAGDLLKRISGIPASAKQPGSEFYPGYQVLVQSLVGAIAAGNAGAAAWHSELERLSIAMAATTDTVAALEADTGSEGLMMLVADRVINLRATSSVLTDISNEVIAEIEPDRTTTPDRTRDLGWGGRR